MTQTDGEAGPISRLAHVAPFTAWNHGGLVSEEFSDPGIDIRAVAPRLSSRLKSETRKYHDDLELSMMNVLADITIDGYIDLLCSLYGYYKPLEDMTAPLLRTAKPQIEIDKRLKVPFLIRALRALHAADARRHRLATCSQLPSASTVEDALGIHYVLEGSTLGGQLIARHLRRILPSLPDGAFDFFLPYGAEAGPMWRGFLQTLDDHCQTPAQEEAVVLSGITMFLSLKSWLFTETT